MTHIMKKEMTRLSACLLPVFFQEGWVSVCINAKVNHTMSINYFLPEQCMLWYVVALGVVSVSLPDNPLIPSVTADHNKLYILYLFILL